MQFCNLLLKLKGSISRAQAFGLLRHYAMPKGHRTTRSSSFYPSATANTLLNTTSTGEVKVAYRKRRRKRFFPSDSSSDSDVEAARLRCLRTSSVVSRMHFILPVLHQQSFKNFCCCFCVQPLFQDAEILARDADVSNVGETDDANARTSPRLPYSPANDESTAEEAAEEAAETLVEPAGDGSLQGNFDSDSGSDTDDLKGQVDMCILF